MFAGSLGASFQVERAARRYHRPGKGGKAAAFLCAVAAGNTREHHPLAVSLQCPLLRKLNMVLSVQMLKVLSIITEHILLKGELELRDNKLITGTVFT